eukprot:gene11430-4597_t
MSSNNEEDPVAQFKKLTGVNESVAKHFIKESGGSVEQAVANYFDYSSKQSKSTAKGNVRTFHDEDEKEEKGKDDQEFFVGSGQNVIGPKGGQGGAKNLVDDIFTKAQQPQPGLGDESDSKPSSSKKDKFAGLSGGRALGSNVTEKKDTMDEEEPKIEPSLKKPEIKEKTLMITFYKNGFQVDDQEFRSFEVPENQEILKALNDGVVPQTLLPGVDRNTMISCQLVDKKSENYEPPKPKFTAFKGSGRSLGGDSGTSKPIEKVEINTNVDFKVDENKPTTTLQLRMPGGKAIKATFNLDHDISTLRKYITSISGLENFSISTAFPRQVLTDNNVTLQEAGLKNTAVLKCKEKYGDVFTLYVGGRYFTYIMDPNEMKIFFVTNKKISFDDAAVEFTNRVFGISRPDFFEGHKELISTVRNSFATNLLEESVTKYIKDLKEEFEKWNEKGEGKLYKTLVKTVFWSNMKTILKEKFDFEKYSECEKLFHDLDDNFEIAASGLIPEFVFKPVANARNYFYQMFDQTLIKFHKNEDDDFDSSLYSALIKKIGTDTEAARYFGIAILWAGEANSLPGTYCDKLMNEIKNVLNDEPLTFENLQKMNYTRNVVMEVFRLHTPGMMIRRVMEPIKIKDYSIPVGYNIAVNPLAVHYDESVWKNAREFNPDRWNDIKTTKYEYLSFGKNTNECPGKRFAINSTMVFLILFFGTFKVEFKEKSFSEPDPTRLIGIPHPKLRDELFTFNKISKK